MVRGGHIFTFRLMVRGGPPVDVPSGKGFQFAKIYYIKLTFNSFYALLYQPKKWAASRDNFSGTDGISMPSVLKKPYQARVITNSLFIKGYWHKKR